MSKMNTTRLLCLTKEKGGAFFPGRPHRDTNEVWKYPCLGTHEACPNKEAHGIQLTLTFKPKPGCTYSSCLSWKVSHVLVVAHNAPPTQVLRPAASVNQFQDLFLLFMCTGGFLKNSLNIVTHTVRSCTYASMPAHRIISLM